MNNPFKKFKVGQLVDASLFSFIDNDYGIVYDISVNNIKLYFLKSGNKFETGNGHLEEWDRATFLHLLKDIKIVK